MPNHSILGLVILTLLAALACDRRSNSEPVNAATRARESAGAPATQSTAATVAVVPGRSVGPVSLGMTRAEVDSLGLEVHPSYSAMTIPFTAYYDDQGVVTSVGVSLRYAPGDITVGEVVIPRGASAQQAAELLADCEEGDVRIGGNITRCRDGGLAVAVGSGDPSEVWVRVPSPH